MAVFAWIQMLAPLLHAHVTASAASLETGIHLPVALVHVGHDHGTDTWSSALVQDESNAITAQPEHRRHELAASDWTQVPALGRTAQPAVVRVLHTVDAASSPVVPGFHWPHPPAQAPPATA